MSEENIELVDINNMRKERKKIRFTKMHGCGNDYVYINCFEQEITAPESLAVPFSDRRKGIGSDGVILIMPSAVADAKMRVFNLDGSEGKMCGNGIRCVGKFLYDKGIVKKKELTVETLSGIKTLFLTLQDDKVFSVRVDMGAAELLPERIPVHLDAKNLGDKIVNEPFEVGGKGYNITCVSMGNPHCVVFVDDVESVDLEKIGPKFEHNEVFPEGINTEFVQVIDDKTIKMRVWERGSGETHACGTGACAAGVASCLNGHCKMGEDVKVRLVGGDLVINYSEDTVYMTGEAKTVFEGEIEA
jgi:carbamoyl-phosphate synthase large subunit